MPRDSLNKPAQQPSTTAFTVLVERPAPRCRACWWFAATTLLALALGLMPLWAQAVSQNRVSHDPAGLVAATTPNVAFAKDIDVGSC
jgi:hypothetical protein